MSLVKKANKVVIIGDSSVGKTCIIERLIKNTFIETKSTIGACHHNKTINGCALDIWDTAGQERFKSMIPMYYKGAKCIIVVFDLFDSNTFEGAKNWLGEIQSNTQNTLIVLCGNKCDLINDLTNDTSVYKQYASNLGFKYFETSAKENINVIELFEAVANDILTAPKEENKEAKVDIMSANNNSSNRGDCGYC